MKIKKGDKVKILKGKDRGKTGKVLQIFASRNRVSIEGMNLLIKHMRPRRQGEKGQRIEFPAPMDLSNLMFICPKCGKPARVGYKYVETARGSGAAASGQAEHAKAPAKRKIKKFRICKKCKQIVD
jgi:large subunit ribosomal protein L24